MLAGIETAGYRSQKSGARSQNGEASLLGPTAFAETLGDVGRNRNCGIWKSEVRSQNGEASFLGLTAFAETLGYVGRNRKLRDIEARSQEPEARMAKRA